MRVELPCGDGGEVISIEECRGRYRHGGCQHHHVLLDPDLSELDCRDCKSSLNPIEWISQLARMWSHVQRQTKTMREQAEKLKKRSRTRCQHCDRITGITREAKFQVVREEAKS